MGYDGTTLAIYDEALRKGDLLLPVPDAPKDRSSIATPLQRHGVHDLGYIGPGTFEQFPILDRADPDLPGTAHCFGGPYVQDRAPFPPHARQEVRPADPPLCTAQPALLLTLQPQVPGRPRRPAARGGARRCQQASWSPWPSAPAGPRRILDSRTGRSTRSEMAFNDVIEKTGMAIDAAGVVVIVTGAAIAFVIAAVRLSRRESEVYRRFRQQLGQTILLGLELLVAGDIVRTVAASPSLTSVAILAAIVFIRTFLSFSLEVETTGRWPWQKRDISAS